jgi:hypothetical protein
MNEDDFARLLDNTSRLTGEQHCRLLNQLVYVYKHNHPALGGDTPRALTWRLKQAWQILHYYLNPSKK